MVLSIPFARVRTHRHRPRIFNARRTRRGPTTTPYQRRRPCRKYRFVRDSSTKHSATWYVCRTVVEGQLSVRRSIRAHSVTGYGGTARARMFAVSTILLAAYRTGRTPQSRHVGTSKTLKRPGECRIDKFRVVRAAVARASNVLCYVQAWIQGRNPSDPSPNKH